MPPSSRRPPSVPWLVGLAALTALAPAVRADEPVSFRNEVMAVLSRGGCNAGACHGNQNGKDGFKLSLRGEDPDFDLAVLTRDTLARRTDRFHPDDSLMLLKATAAVPHEGATRFAVGSREYDILRRWIAAGCLPDRAGSPVLQRLDVTPRQLVLTEPADEVPLHVTATFSDGRVARRDRPVRLRAVQPRRPRRPRRRRPPAIARRNDHPGALSRPAGGRATGLRPEPARLRLERPAREQLHRPSRLRQAAHAAHAAVRPVFRRRLPPPRLPRRARPAADAGGGAPLPRRRPAGQARPAHRRLAGTAGVRRLLGVEMVRPAAQRGESRSTARASGCSTTGSGKASPTASRSTSSRAS